MTKSDKKKDEKTLSKGEENIQNIESTNDITRIPVTHYQTIVFFGIFIFTG